MNNSLKKSETAHAEERILSFWKDQNIFEKSLLEKTKGDFVFYDGPPFATGLPHYGHLLAGTIKDIIPRYMTMKGHHVSRTWGWDCHGLPIENLVEKELGLSSKKDIEEYGIATFNQKARDSVLRYEQEWKQYVPRSGRFINMDQPYMSMHTNYMESVWWIFSQLHKKQLTKQGFKPMHLCPRCETTLANFEVNQGYMDVTDISATVSFQLVDEPETHFLAWTTTPWTLPGNVALAVGKDIEYVKVSEGDLNYIVAKKLCDLVFEGRTYEIVDTMKGSDLIGKKYQPVFDYFKKNNIEHSERGWQVYEADFVTTEEGTGIVHIAPAFGSDDMELGETHRLPFIQHVGRNGVFIDSFAEGFKGMKVKAKGDWMTADIEIIKWLAHNGKLFSKKKLVHSYPHCWRCDTPLLNYATSSWFIDVPSMKERLMELNAKVNWVPEHVGEGRFGKWLEGARDWALSRSRFWGTPLPVWQNASATETLVIGSIEELLSHIPSSGNTYIGVRHGESVSNATGEINAKRELHNPLTETGRKQAESEAQKLKDMAIDYLFVSPFQRTMETASIIKEQLGLSDSQIIVDERLRERNPGDSWEGKQWHDAHTQEERERDGDFWNYKLEDNAESIGDIYKRVMPFLFELEETYAGKNIVIITHGGVLKTILFGLKHHGDHTKAHAFFNETALPSNAELISLPFKKFPHNDEYEIDLHRPYLDTVTLIDSNGEEMKLLGDVFDVWFDSGSMPYAQVHYPFENKDLFEEQRFPAQFIAEGLDQTRGWFYVLSVLGVALFDTIPFENVIVNGLILAEDGKKMSKSLNNYPDPHEMFNSVGADAIRLYLIASPAVRGEEFAFSEKSVRDVSSKVMGRMRNVVNLYTTYKANVDHTYSFDSQNVLDIWMQARLIELLHDVQSGLEVYQLDKAARPIFDFVDDFSTWYVRRSRDRYKMGEEKDMHDALATTRMSLKVFAQISAPFVPFLSEEIWQMLREDDSELEESVHLSSWPTLELNEGHISALESMKRVREIVSEGLQMRSDSGIKVRQPLSSLQAPLEGLHEEYHLLITDELNVKKLVSGDKYVLDTEVTNELQLEGDVRELLRFIQIFRKDQGLDAHDTITLSISTSDEGRNIIESHIQEIKNTASINEIVFQENEGTTVEVRDVSFTLSIM